MKSFKLFFGALSLVATATTQAAQLVGDFDTHFTLLSYTLTPSGGSPVSIAVYPSTPLASDGLFSLWDTGARIEIATGYHVVSYGSGGNQANVTYTALEQDAFIYGGLPKTPGHVTYSGSDAGSSFQLGTYCASPTGNFASCQSLTSEFGTINMPTKYEPTFFLDLVFDPTVEHFTGTIDFKTVLSDGSTLTRTYSMVGDVPLPTTGLMFGSAVLALAGARRRKV